MKLIDNLRNIDLKANIRLQNENERISTVFTFESKKKCVFIEEPF